MLQRTSLSDFVLEPHIFFDMICWNGLSSFCSIIWAYFSDLYFVLEATFTCIFLALFQTEHVFTDFGIQKLDKFCGVKQNFSTVLEFQKMG